jgi:hypothetical protein
MQETVGQQLPDHEWRAGLSRRPQRKIDIHESQIHLLQRKHKAVRDQQSENYVRDGTIVGRSPAVNWLVHSASFW